MPDGDCSVVPLAVPLPLPSFCIEWRGIEVRVAVSCPRACKPEIIFFEMLLKLLFKDRLVLRDFTQSSPSPIKISEQVYVRFFVVRVILFAEKKKEGKRTLRFGIIIKSYERKRCENKERTCIVRMRNTERNLRNRTRDTRHSVQKCNRSRTALFSEGRQWLTNAISQLRLRDNWFSSSIRH